jgi:hypothetical protein
MANHIRKRRRSVEGNIMTVLSSSIEEFTAEIRVKGECPTPGGRKSTVLRIWDEDGLIRLLCHQTGKGESEVRKLLASYHRPVAKVD